MLLFTVLGDTYPQKHRVKHSVASSNTEKHNTFNKFLGPGPFFGRTKSPEAAAGHDTLVLRTQTILCSIAHERTDRTSRRAEIPLQAEAALRAAPQKGAATSGGRPPLWTPLVEESQPSRLSGPYTHATCWLKMSFPLKLKCCAPQLPLVVLFGQKMGPGLKKLNSSQLKCNFPLNMLI